MWFNNWQSFLEDCGFGKTTQRGRRADQPFAEAMEAKTVAADDDGEEEFATEPHQLRRIANIDESCPSLDGSSQRQGG